MIFLQTRLRTPIAKQAPRDGKRTSIDFSDLDIQRIHAIIERHLLPTKAAAIRWAGQTVAQAVEIFLKSSSGETVRLTREGRVE